VVAIGGKTKKKAAPIKPQYVVQIAEGINEFMLISIDDQQQIVIDWIGDPNSATKFDSKYHAKTRVRDIENVPETRTFKMLEQKKK
jgi:hypothetical protein